MTLLVRDEEDIIEANLDYHLNRGVDFVIVTDNDSTDATPELLDRYVRQGVVHVIRETERPRSRDRWQRCQALWVTRMARLAATDFEADWVINADADEFWWPKIGTLKDVFAAIPDGFGAVEAPQINFIPRPDQAVPFYDRMVVAEVMTVSRHGARARRTPPKVAHRRSPSVTVKSGNHSVTGEGLTRALGWQPILVFHYPVRTPAQLLTKLERKIVEVPAGRVDALEPGSRPAYEIAVPSEEAVEAGLRDGRFVIDRRLHRFLGMLERQRRGEADGPLWEPWPADLSETLRFDLWRAVHESRLAEERLGRLTGKRAGAHESSLSGRLARLRARLRSARAYRW